LSTLPCIFCCGRHRNRTLSVKTAQDFKSCWPPMVATFQFNIFDFKRWFQRLSKNNVYSKSHFSIHIF